MTLPNFLIIGAQRSGTTSLYNYLRQHPQIFMSPIKEPRFFVFDGEEFPSQGKDEASPSAARYQNFRQRSIWSFDDYCALFQGVRDEKAIGEASPHYLYHPRSADRIKARLPGVKLVAILRDPVERAYSNYFLSIRDNKRQVVSDFIEKAREERKLNMDNIWDGSKHYLRKGFYAAQLIRYHKVFPPNQMRVYLYEDLKSNLHNLIQDVFRFLEVDDSFIPDMSSKFSTSGQVMKNKKHLQFLSNRRWLIGLSKMMLSDEIRHEVLKKISLCINSRNEEIVTPPLPPELRSELIQIYRDDILRLQDLIQRDLSAWLSIEKIRVEENEKKLEGAYVKGKSLQLVRS